jgi:hypothetical protein
VIDRGDWIGCVAAATKEVDNKITTTNIRSSSNSDLQETTTTATTTTDPWMIFLYALNASTKTKIVYEPFLSLNVCSDA